ncbi:MAG: GPW/gp25 family protein [Saprospiraceae bacterium]|nr:GPW/gp25 family protein [Saprospiraceae bacterium]
MGDQSFLGRGWSFPPEFDPETAEARMVENVEDIRQSLDILLATSLGERVMQPLYGCNMADFQFEPVSNSLLGLLRSQIENAILYHEPRIIPERIAITPADSFDLIEGRLTIEIDYMVARTNSRFNYVYDYYLREANRPA